MKKCGASNRKAFNTLSTKIASVLEISHKLRKGLQAETLSLCGGMHQWFKKRSTRGKELCDKR
jgi:hypothetical protein